MTLTKEQIFRAYEPSTGVILDRDLDPCILTDKTEHKIFPCRKCHRACVVNRFAAIAKTECATCRGESKKQIGKHGVGDEQKQPTQAEFDRSKEPHTLTDKEETKELPCRSCRRPCIVNQFAAPAKVACFDCRGSVSPPKRTIKIEKDNDGRFREKVKVEGPGNIQWTEWTIGTPIYIERLYLRHERKAFEQFKNAAFEAGQRAKEAKKRRQTAEEKLNSIPDKPRKVDSKEADKEKKRLDTERTKAEIERDEADQLEIQQLDIKRTNEKEQTKFARIAWIRGALSIGYKIEQRDNRRYLIGHERNVAIPDDFLDNAGYHTAHRPRRGLDA